MDIHELAQLREHLAAREDELRLLQQELDETNRGVVALYAELDEQAELLRRAKQLSDVKFKAIYDLAPSGIALLDSEGRITEVNSAMERMLGRNSPTLRGMALAAMTPSEWTSALAAVSSMQAEGLSHQEVPMTRGDGSTVHIEWSITPDIDAGVSMALATDVSQRVELGRLRVQWLDRERVARSEAEHVSRMKDDFIAVLAHELRTPLNAIAGWTQVLKSRVPADLQRGVDAIDRNCKTQARMISDLLDMSRLRLGKLAMTFEAVDPVEEIREAANAVRSQAEQQGLTLEVSVEGLPRRIQSDPSRLQQVVWNLLTNAIKFTPKGGLIRVELVEADHQLLFHVTDSGQGMSAEFLPLVFDRFSQSDAGTNRQRGGLGLGLSIVKQIVDAHGGAISVDSAGVGQGSRFTVVLPFLQAEVDTAAPDQGSLDAANQPLAGLDLLIVEDDDDASAVLAVVLSDRGATVRVARDADAALMMLAARRPNVLVSDIGMPGKDGFALIREVRLMDAGAARPRLPAIALTAFTRDVDRLQALEAGFDAHCGKPLKPLEVVRQVALLTAAHA